MTKSIESSEREWIRGIFQARYGRIVRFRADERPLRGGLEAVSVVRLTASFSDPRGREHRVPLVVKRLEGAAARELEVYQRLLGSHAAELAPQLLGARRSRAGVELLLEAVRQKTAWPWRDLAVVHEVIRRLAMLHRRVDAVTARAALPAWDYEGALHASAVETLELLDKARRQPNLARIRPYARPVARIVSGLPRVRRALLNADPFGSSLVHGDAHPGNALVAERSGRPVPLLIDWGRARVGAPFEDISSWLQALGYWEPEARRRHDTLLMSYLSERGLPRRLYADLRAAYWLAGASNALAGALAYHLSRALDSEQRGRARAVALHSAEAWLRVLRRADAVWS